MDTDKKLKHLRAKIKGISDIPFHQPMKKAEEVEGAVYDAVEIIGDLIDRINQLEGQQNHETT